MTEEQKKMNKELSEMRETFMKKYGIECSTCVHHTKTDRCASRIKCIVRDKFFFTPYQKKE